MFCRILHGHILKRVEPVSRSPQTVLKNKEISFEVDKMDVESRKSFKHGFILKETDLRRLIDTAIQQLEKIPGSKVGQPTFKMKFKNGVLAETPSLDEVLAQENSGSGKIIRLSYGQEATDSPNPSHIFLEFINADEDDETGLVSLRFHVFGHSRDWVFVTSSLLEERFEKIKRFSFNQLGKGSNRFFLCLH